MPRNTGKITDTGLDRDNEGGSDISSATLAARNLKLLCLEFWLPDILSSDSFHLAFVDGMIRLVEGHNQFVSRCVGDCDNFPQTDLLTLWNDQPKSSFKFVVISDCCNLRRVLPKTL